MNIDLIRQELIEFKKIISEGKLNKSEETEINAFIDSLVLELEEKTKKINIAELSVNLENYFKEK
tara:strand:- start:398 stop:592 length:195 start_codon:yes stop_codon:yes gene_type:complete